MIYVIVLSFPVVCLSLWTRLSLVDWAKKNDFQLSRLVHRLPRYVGLSIIMRIRRRFRIVLRNTRGVQFFAAIVAALSEAGRREEEIREFITGS